MNDFDRFNEVIKARGAMELNGEYLSPSNAVPPNGDISVKDVIKRQPIPRWLRILLYVLLSAIIVSFVYSSAVHPLDKVKIKTFFTRNYTIEVVASGGYAGVNREYIRFDGNIIQIGFDYYEFDNGILYTYVKDSERRWKRVKSDDYNVKSSYNLGAKLLDSSNYELDKLFVWKLKDDVAKDIDELSRITVQRKAGKVSIVGYYSFVEVSLRFTSFGTTKITPPWKE